MFLPRPKSRKAEMRAQTWTLILPSPASPAQHTPALGKAGFCARASLKGHSPGRAQLRSAPADAAGLSLINHSRIIATTHLWKLQFRGWNCILNHLGAPLPKPLIHHVIHPISGTCRARIPSFIPKQAGVALPAVGPQKSGVFQISVLPGTDPRKALLWTWSPEEGF